MLLLMVLFTASVRQLLLLLLLIHLDASLAGHNCVDVIACLDNVVLLLLLRVFFFVELYVSQADLDIAL